MRISFFQGRNFSFGNGKVKEGIKQIAATSAISAGKGIIPSGTIENG